MPCDTFLKEADSVCYVTLASVHNRFLFFEKKKNTFDQTIASITSDILHCRKSLLPQGNSLRHQIGAGNVLGCMEDEPYKGHECSFKNTRCNIVISSALKASITAVVKKKLLRSL